MKEYVISVVITSVLIALSELIIPQGKLKSIVSMIFTITLLISIISPFDSIEDLTPVFNLNTEYKENINEETKIAFEKEIENFYEKQIKTKLLAENLVTEKINVEISGIEIVRIQIYLSNLVIPENNEHINNNVIRNYVAEKIGIETEKVEIYA